MSKKAKRILTKLNDPKHRARLAREVHLLDQDEPGQVDRRDKEMTILKEMNDLQQFQDDVWSSGSM